MIFCKSRNVPTASASLTTPVNIFESADPEIPCTVQIFFDRARVFDGVKSFRKIFIKLKFTGENSKVPRTGEKILEVSTACIVLSILAKVLNSILIDIDFV